MKKEVTTNTVITYLLNFKEVEMVASWREWCVDQNDCDVCSDRAKCQETWSYFQAIKKELGG